MGTWGEGNFDNDDAGEFLDGVIEDLRQKIETYLMPELVNQSGYLANYGLGKLMPAIDIVITLCHHYRAGFPVEVETVQQWRHQFLRIFDDKIDVYSPISEFKTARRQVIESTFDELQKLAAEWES